ncbi:metalloprotease family protein [Gracilibacillus sp. JCM 18860]|uniref:metalloprotease family protein n=1 Tax=Gracilibacillus sp. JCM 18860 TaxID=1306159 RepID=UPI0006D18679
MKVVYSLDRVSFWLFVQLFLGHYKKLLVAMVVFSLLPLVIDTSWTMARYILQFYVIFFGGLFLSFIIHEYLHAILLKKSREEGELEVEFTFAKITIYPKFTLTSKEMMKVAAMPLFILLVIGLVLIIFAKWTNQNFLMFTGFLYVFHVINIIPPLGDGMMIIKAIFHKDSTLERR